MGLDYGNCLNVQMGSFSHLGFIAHTAGQVFGQRSLSAGQGRTTYFEDGYGEFGPYVNDGWDWKFGL